MMRKGNRLDSSHQQMDSYAPYVTALPSPAKEPMHPDDPTHPHQGDTGRSVSDG
jgi:hypothetical protein